MLGKNVDWFQRVANSALIVSLILVGYQIKQANDIASATLATAAFQQETDRSLAIMGENPSVVIAKAILEPENLTPDEIVALLATADWRYSMMTRNNRMEEYGVFGNHWHSYLEVQGRVMGRTPVVREYLLNDPRDDWWIKEMQKAAAVQPKGSAQDVFLQVYIDAAKSYGDNN